MSGEPVNTVMDSQSAASLATKAASRPTAAAAGVGKAVTPAAQADDGAGAAGAIGQPPTNATQTLAANGHLPETAFAPEVLDTGEPAAETCQPPVAWDAADAVTELYNGHYSQLVRLAVMLVHDVQTAEEVVQEAFVSMNSAWRRLRESDKALQYLQQTVMNKSRSVLRHRKVVDMHAPKHAPDEPSAEHAALASLERHAVASALRSLPERQREAILLRYYLDLSEADTAKSMGISKGAVKSHTARAIAALKTVLAQES